MSTPPVQQYYHQAWGTSDGDGTISPQPESWQQQQTPLEEFGGASVSRYVSSRSGTNNDGGENGVEGCNQSL